MIKDDGGEHDIKTVGGCVLTAKESMGKITLDRRKRRCRPRDDRRRRSSRTASSTSIDKVLLPKM